MSIHFEIGGSTVEARLKLAQILGAPSTPLASNSCPDGIDDLTPEDLLRRVAANNPGHKSLQEAVAEADAAKVKP